MHNINPLKAQLNPICHVLALLGAHHILHVSRIRVNASRGPIHEYEYLKRKLYNCNATIYFNQ